MARRFIAIPLAVAIAIAVFSSFCFADIPVNNYISSYNVYLVDWLNSNPNTFSGYYSLSNLYDFQTGETYFFATDLGGTNNQDILSLTFDFTLSYTFDIYIPVYIISLQNNKFDYSSLSDYYYPEGNLNHTFPAQSYDLIYLNNNVPSFYDTNVGNTGIAVTFLCFKDVPSGTAFRVYDNLISSGTYGPVVNNISFTWRFTGIFISFQTVTSEEVVDDYISGDLPFSDALTNLNNSINSAIDLAQTLDQKQFELLKGQYELDRLIANSDNKSVQNVQQSITPGLNQTINDYVSGDLSLDDALSDMSQQYIAALNSAVTPEQGTFINTTYQIKMQQFELEARRKAAAKVDSAISDDQLSEADEYYRSEEELISKFQVSEFESALDFELWFNTLPPSESTEYKKFFDYILNDSSIRMFLIIPISLVLVRIIFGTVLHLRVRHD